jgi:hypothetical protein
MHKIKLVGLAVLLTAGHIYAAAPVKDLGSYNTLSVGSISAGTITGTTVTGAISGDGAALTNSASTLSIGGTGSTNVTVDLSGNNTFVLTATTNIYFLQPTNLVPGKQFSIEVRQDSTGIRYVGFDTNYWKFPGGVIQTATTNASAVDLLSCQVGRYGTNVLIVQSLDFR